jgi:hypothetical protein
MALGDCPHCGPLQKNTVGCSWSSSPLRAAASAKGGWSRRGWGPRRRSSITAIDDGQPFLQVLDHFHLADRPDALGHVHRLDGPPRGVHLHQARLSLHRTRNGLHLRPSRHPFKLQLSHRVSSPAHDLRKSALRCSCQSLRPVKTACDLLGHRPRVVLPRAGGLRTGVGVGHAGVLSAIPAVSALP